MALPIWQIYEAIVGAARASSRFVLVAPTGSGKTTQLPQMLLDAGLAGDRKIVVLQPRRVAARTVAARVAWERKSKLGAEIGYQIRFEDRTSLGTRVCFVTEGILLRWLQDDPALGDISIIVFDEFHERNLLSDVSLGLVKHIQQTVRPDLRVVVMSATLDAAPIAKYLDDCPILISEGQTFGVEINYLDLPDERPPSEQAADAIESIIRSGDPGDILVFMPGMGEINATIGACRSIRSGERLNLIPLHGELPPEDQDRAFAPSEVRKVVVSTNVAETSVTIDGIRHVVDSGLARVARYDPARGISTFFVEEISRASADQRKGRAGRTAPGTCLRLWTENNHLNRAERNTPEIQRADLAEVVLLLHSLGIKRAADFDWLDKPDANSVARAEQLLEMLGALDSRAADTSASDLTPLGRQMLSLPMHPRYSRMLVEAAARGCIREAALCAALVSGRDLLIRLSRDDKHIAEARELFETGAESDFYTLMRAYEFARKNNFNIEACRRYGVHAQIARQVEQTFDQIIGIAARLSKGNREPEQVNAGALARCIVAGFIDQLAKRRDQGTLECDLTEGRSGTLMRESVVQDAPWLVASVIREVSGRGGIMTLLGLATAVKLEWIKETFPQHIRIDLEHLFDRTHKRVAAIKLVRFRDLVLEHEHQRDLDPNAAGRSLAQAYSNEYFELPLFNHELKQFIGRVNLVTKVLPELEFPTFDSEAIINCLTKAFRGFSLVKEAQAQPLMQYFADHLAPEQRTWLNEIAPLSIEFAGRRGKLLYPAPGATTAAENSPELQVKLQDCFGMKEHPFICEGKCAVTLWFCAPDGKRLASTTDWPRFRSLEYPKLKPMLLKKYSGVPWV
jgi:ATP-dependent helicase HrpB